MSKVKKVARKTVVRNAARIKPVRKRSVNKTPVKKTPKPDSSDRFHIKELDPVRKCGAGTSVERLYKVIERAPHAMTHLVFLDRHGWYCEHGRACPAVGYARKHRGRIARGR